MAPDWALPVVFEMVEPVGRLDQRRAASCERVSNSNAVGRGTEMDFLLRCCRRLRRCGGFIFCRLIYRADEANALARDGPNQPLLIATVADRFARGVDATGESRVRHDPAAPNRSDKIVLANHAVTVLDEIQQQVEHLWLKRDELRGPPKLSALRIEYVVFKAKLHVCPRRGFSRYAKVYWKDNSARCRSLLHFASRLSSPLWVKSRHLQCNSPCSLYPQKRPQMRIPANGHVRFTSESGHVSC